MPNRKEITEIKGSGFKLLAIRPLNNCEYYLKKNLKNGELYKFYQNYTYTFEDNDINKIEINRETLPDIYSHKNEDNILSINVSALVGKNGSGKSSLLELFYAFCFCISKDESGIKETIERYKKEFQFLNKDISDVINNLQVEIFYSLNEAIKSIKYKGGNFLEYSFTPERSEGDDKVKVKDFAYSIAVNYSLYGLNETDNPWLRLLFHKNDGYQTPLVINPMRTKGVIDVNKEFSLSQSRIMLNIANSKTNLFEIVKDKYLSSIDFKIEPISLQKVGYYKGEFPLNDIFKLHEMKHKESVYHLYNRLLNKIFGDGSELCNNKISKFINYDVKGIKDIIEEEYKKANGESVDYNLIEYLFVKYIIKKIFKICLNYKSYRNKYIEIDKGKSIPYLTQGSFDDLIQDLFNNKSHITFKLKQAIYTVQNRLLENEMWWRNTQKQINRDKSKELKFFEFVIKDLSIDNFKTITRKNNNNNSYFEDIHKVPGAFVKPIFKYQLPDKNDSSTQKMSSGEQQFFHSINTITYHLRNLDSIKENGSIKAYKNVNILLDEIELYYHPEFQREYLSILISNIKNLNLDNIKNINILFSTHSPFILSDIPSVNILRMERGSASTTNFEQTFGANIHDLLANDFFLENGFMGEFAKKKIEETIRFLNLANEKKKCLELKDSSVIDVDALLPIEIENKLSQYEDKGYYYEVINLIGEPVLKLKLKAMYVDCFETKNEEKMSKEYIERLAKEFGYKIEFKDD